MIAGRPPIDLEARAVTAAWELANGYQPNIPIDNELDARTWMLQEWQRRWDRSAKGRYTYQIFPSVARRVDAKHVHVDHYMAQFLTGHGDFSAKLFSLGLKSSPLCP